MQGHHTKDVVRNITTAAQLESELQLAQAQHGVAVLDVYNAEWSHCKALGETFRRLFTDAGDVVYLRFYSVECNAVLESMEHTTTSAAGTAAAAMSAMGGMAGAAAAADEAQRLRAAAPRGVTYAHDTTPAHWGNILKARQRRSQPYFVFYKEGRLRGCLEGIDTPRIVKMVHELCKPQKPAAAYVTNESVLQFWHAQLPPDESEIVWDEFAVALQRAGMLRGTGAAAVTSASGAVVHDSRTVAALKAACGCERDVVTAAGVQAWVGGTRTFAEAVAETLASVHDTTTRTRDTDSDAGKKADSDVCDADAATAAAADGTSASGEEAGDEEGAGGDKDAHASPGDGDVLSSSSTATAPRPDAGTSETAVSAPAADAAVEAPFAHDNDRRVYDVVVSLPLHYPCSTRNALSPYSDAERDAIGAMLARLESVDTLAAHLRRSGVSDDALRALCAAAGAKIRGDMGPYSKLALLLASADAAALAQLDISPTDTHGSEHDAADTERASGSDVAEAQTTATTTTRAPVDYYAAVCNGTLMQHEPALALSVLCLCASAADTHECFYYCPPADAMPTCDSMRQWQVGDVVMLAALTPLLSRRPTHATPADGGDDAVDGDASLSPPPPEGEAEAADATATATTPYAVCVVGLPGVIELVTTDTSSDDDAVVLLSGWYAQLTVEEQTPDATVLRFLEYAHAAAYDACAHAYTLRSEEDAAAMDDVGAAGAVASANAATAGADGDDGAAHDGTASGEDEHTAS